MENVFDIDNFNIIEDEENYYFFRALNMADNQDLETGIISDKAGNFEKIRTDRERYEENLENGAPKYSKDDQISLEQLYDHIKCITEKIQIVYHFQAMVMCHFLWKRILQR